MDRGMIADQLAMAEGHVAEGDFHIVRQLVIIARLQGMQLPSALAEQLLETFRASQAQHVADRDRLKELLND
jgi:hypothetical protein